MNALDRQSRLAAALRENLKRRKRQTRERVREADEGQVDAPASSGASLMDAGLTSTSLTDVSVDTESLNLQAKDRLDGAQD